MKTDSPADERWRLTCEYQELAAVAARGQLDDRERIAAVRERLRVLAATPPAGYLLPAVAEGLVAHTEAPGWTALVQWTAVGYSTSPFVTVLLGRLGPPESRGGKWIYKLTWHSRDCLTGRLPLFGQRLA